MTYQVIAIKTEFNLTDKQWLEGINGVWLSSNGWYARDGGRELGPFGQREFIEEEVPDFFE
jgi:hypothetical protein